MESAISNICSSNIEQIRDITWDMVKEETKNDYHLSRLITMILSEFPNSKQAMTPQLEQYWELKDNLSIVNGGILYKEKVVIPPTLRVDVLQSLHAAHQGVCAMNERAKSAVYWPGITGDIAKIGSSCSSCNRAAPSQPRTPPIELWIPTTPFEAIAMDYFHYIGKYYFVAADRLSGWTETQLIKLGTKKAGAEGLCSALQRIFVTFGVTVEISSDGGQSLLQI